MDDISALIKEAKPLYFARKKRNNRIKAALCSLVLLLGIGSFYPKSEGYTMSYDYYLFGTEFSVSENYEQGHRRGRHDIHSPDTQTHRRQNRRADLRRCVVQ